MSHIDLSCNESIESRFARKTRSQDDLLRVKHMSVLGEYSSVILVFDKEYLEHATLQSIRHHDRDQILRQISLKALLESQSDFIVQFQREMIIESDYPLSWFVYENCFCFMCDYLSIVRFDRDSPGEYFMSDNDGECLDRLYVNDSDAFAFDLKYIAIEFVIRLFDIVEYLREARLNSLFFLSNILVTIHGQLKLFPGHDNITRFSKNKDPEDIIIDLIDLKDKLEVFKTVLKDIDERTFESDESTDYLRNLFSTGLISVRILFRDWSPFRTADLTEKQMNVFQVKNKTILNKAQEIWLIRTVYDHSLSQGFIRKGLLTCFSNDKVLQVLMTRLVEVFQPRNKRYFKIDRNELGNEFFHSTAQFDFLSKFLHEHYQTLLFRNQHNYLGEYETSRKRKFNDSGCSNINAYEHDGCYHEEDDDEDNNRGISNWLTDSSAFMQLSQIQEPESSEQGSESCSCAYHEFESDQNGSSFVSSERSENNYFEQSDGEESKEVGLSFDLSANNKICKIDENDKVFPIFKTNKNELYLDYLSKKAQIAKITVNSVPKPTIICHPNGFCSLRYDFDSEYKVHFNGIPLRFIFEDMENSSCNNCLSNSSLPLRETLDEYDIKEMNDFTNKGA